MRAAQDVTLCVNVSAGKAGRMCGNYANGWENFRCSGAICGFLWPLLQCRRHGQGSGTRLQNPRAHKTPKCSSASQAACWKQDSSATLCLGPLMPWSVSLSLCLLCLVHWHVGTMTISYSCLASITFSLPHRMFA